LNANRHSNPYLQSAWNFYGKDNFIFEKIAFANSTDELDLLERKFIAECKSDNREFGYNIFSGGHHQHGVPDEVRSKIGNANKGNRHSDDQRQKWAREKRKNVYSPHVLSPDEVLYSVDNIRSFCITHKLDKRNFTRLLKGNIYHVKGWRLPTTPKEFCNRGHVSFITQSKLYGKEICSPNGTIHVIDIPLKDFCNTHNLVPKKIRLVLTGKQKHHRGWKKKENIL
jgi:hypothetical protein